MTTLVVDIEANGFYEDVTKIHCIVCKDVETQKLIVYRSDTTHTGMLRSVLNILQKADKIIGHNFIDYDARVIEKLYGVKIPVEKIIDTYLLSCMLRPDRRKRKGCKKGAHSLENWGYIVGRGKPDHDDWDNFSLEMLERCREDVLITELTAQYLEVL